MVEQAQIDELKKQIKGIEIQIDELFTMVKALQTKPVEVAKVVPTVTIPSSPNVYSAKVTTAPEPKPVTIKTA
jgi:hypothetical protein